MMILSLFIDASIVKSTYNELGWEQLWQISQARLQLAPCWCQWINPQSHCWKESSLLLSVVPDGEWIGMIKSETIKSEEFTIYLLILSKMIQELHWDNRMDVYILLDNAKVHHSFTTLKFITALRLKMIYLPAYSPEFAQVELWFKGIKYILKADISPSKLDYSKEDGALGIENALVSISKEYIQDCWLKAIKQLEEWVCKGFRQDLLFWGDPEQLREAQE